MTKYPYVMSGVTLLLLIVIFLEEQATNGMLWQIIYDREYIHLGFSIIGFDFIAVIHLWSLHTRELAAFTAADTLRQILNWPCCGKGFTPSCFLSSSSLVFASLHVLILEKDLTVSKCKVPDLDCSSCSQRWHHIGP